MEAKPRLLIVDDDADLRNTLRHALRADFEVEDTGDGVSALKLVAERAYDLVLLDVSMPGLDGYSVCKAIRVLPGGDRVKVVFLTGRRGVGGRVEGRTVGADAYITKPFSPRGLREELQRLLAPPG